MHPVDKVHVGVAGGPEHDPIAGRLAEAGMRGQVLRADVGLDLDDPPDAPSGGVVADEEGTQQRATRLQAGAGQDRPVEGERPAQCE